MRQLFHTFILVFVFGYTCAQTSTLAFDYAYHFKENGVFKRLDAVLYTIYLDKDYLLFESQMHPLTQQNNDVNLFAPKVILETATGQVSICFNFDSLQLRYLDTEGLAKLDELFGRPESLIQIDTNSIETIAGFACHPALAISVNGDTIQYAVTKLIEPNFPIPSYPVFIKNGAQGQGYLILRREMPTITLTVYTLATRVETGSAKNVQEELEQYRLLSKEDFSAAYRAWLTNKFKG